MPTTLSGETAVRVLRLAAPGADIASWSVVADAYPARTPTTGALDRLIGTTTDGARVSAFVKTINSLRHWPMIGVVPEQARAAMIASFPWRVEPDVYASHLLDRLPPGLRGPQIHLVEELGDDRVRVWMEDVPQEEVRWDGARYAAAARGLGRMAARFAADRPLGAIPPLFMGLRFMFVGRTTAFEIPALRDESTWHHPAMTAVVELDPTLREDLVRLADAAPAIVEELDGLPQSLAQGDACPQNLLADPDRDGGFVLIDWGFAALAPVGYDLGQLLAGRANSGELDAADMPALEDLLIEAYVDGARGEAVHWDPGVVRRGFVGGMLLRSAFGALPIDALPDPSDGASMAVLRARARFARSLLHAGARLGWP
jgi:hypothetical protein